MKFYPNFRPVSAPVPFRDQLNGSQLNHDQTDFRSQILRLEDPLMAVVIDLIRRMPEIQHEMYDKGNGLFRKIEYYLLFDDPSLSHYQRPDELSQVLNLFKRPKLNAQEMQTIGRTIFIDEFDTPAVRDQIFGQESALRRIKNY